MPRRARWALRASTALLFLAGYLALGSVQGYGNAPLLAALLVLAISPLAERLDRAQPAYRMFTRALTVIYLCFIPLTVLRFEILNAVIALVIYIQFHTMLHDKEEKSYYHIYLMSFFLLLAACYQSPEASISLVLFLFLAATIWAFFSLRVAFEAAESRTQVPADIVRFGEEPIKQYADVRDPFDFGMVGYLLVMGIASIVITVGVFFATPRVEAGLLGRSNAPVPLTGVPDSVRLQSGKTILQDFTPVLRAEFPEAPQGRTAISPLYWRITSLSKFNGESWEREPIEGIGDPGIGQLIQATWRQDTSEVQRRRRNSPLEHQVVYMDEVPPSGMPVLDLVQRLRLTTPQRETKVDWDDSNDFTVELRVAGSRQMHYEAWSEVNLPDPEALRADNGDYGLSESDVALLTEEQLLPETLAIVREVVAGLNNNYDRVRALERYLGGENFTYSLTVPQLPVDHPIDAFITRLRVGHCELFATALAQMTRSLGIPARVVSGFKGGDFEPGEGAYIIRKSMAHLWVEVLFAEHGWVRFNPSPQSSADENPGAFERLRMQASLMALRARMLWFRDVVGYSGFRVWNLNDLRFRIFGEIRQFQTRVSDAAAAGEFNATIGVAGFTVGLVCVVGMIYLGIKSTSNRYATTLGVYELTRDQQRAITLFRTLRRKLRRAGLDVQGKTAEELLEAIEDTDWPERAEAARLLDAYNAARFGDTPLPTDRLREFIRAVRSLRLRHDKA